MKGDFSRDTFDPFRRFSRVLMQQGRVQLDADWNEQVSIFSHYLRRLATHLIGPHGAPAITADAFKITVNLEDGMIKISAGDYYVKGILCENERERNYYDQPDYPLIEKEKIIPLASGGYLVYLDVWERHLSYIEDDYMRETALNGPDTATRAKIVWQVKLISHKDFSSVKPEEFKENYGAFLLALTVAGKRQPGRGLLRARARKAPKDNNDPCLISPDARYRGAENQLYRVEIHKGGKITENGVNHENVTFKFSRENGAVIFPIVGIDGKTITLEHFGRDARFGLKPNDWVEIVDDDYILQNRADSLWQIETVDSENSTITVKTPSAGTPDKVELTKHPYLRRWDQKGSDLNDGMSLKEVEGGNIKDWIELEDGVEIQFLEPDSQETPVYQTGDYWLIPARTSTGDVEWPGDLENPDFIEAQGVDHHYAPLKNIVVAEGGTITEYDLRRKIVPISQPVGQS